ncbi:MAG: class II aldolase/adducin family protein [Acidobacteria bacterium]|nr:class II aldolase/adducin family protein [Acidobacteriota bacterium]
MGPSGDDSLSAASAAEQVALGCRIIAGFGHEDLTLGHVSVRSTTEGHVYIKRKGIALGEVTPDDVIEIDLNDNDCLATPGMHLEAAIHVEVYRSRPDVGAVIHSHPLYATALGATSTDVVFLEFLTHDSVLFKDGIGIYSDSAELVTTTEQGKKVADALGGRRAALLKNHGVVVAGEDIRWAVMAAITLERAIHLQILARRLGSLDPLSQEDAESVFPAKYQDKLLDEYWALWERRFGAGLSDNVHGTEAGA